MVGVAAKRGRGNIGIAVLVDAMCCICSGYMLIYFINAWEQCGLLDALSLSFPLSSAELTGWLPACPLAREAVSNRATRDSVLD